MSTRRSALLAALAFIVVILLAVALTPKDDSPRERQPSEPQPTTIPAPASVGVDGADPDVKPDTALPLDREARVVYQNATETPERHDMSGDLRGVDDTPVVQHDGPLATPNFPGCTTRILPANWSERVSTVKAVGLHYTAGGNREGLSDMNGLTGYASSPSAGVSWHFLIDAEGHCYYSVPLGKKAWTIGNLNSETVNIEVIGRGNERGYPSAPAGARKLGAVVRRLGRIFGIPMRVGAVSNCKVTRRGIITHWQGGSCSGGHRDVKPYNLDRIAATIRAQACNAKCRRQARHVVVHRRLRELLCSDARARARHPGSCRKLSAENRELHGKGV